MPHPLRQHLTFQTKSRPPIQLYTNNEFALKPVAKYAEMFYIEMLLCIASHYAER